MIALARLFVHRAIKCAGRVYCAKSFAFPLSSRRGRNSGMDYALLVLTVAFAASCLWLTVRIINRERRAKRTLVALITRNAESESSGVFAFTASFARTCALSRQNRESCVPPTGTT